MAVNLTNLDGTPADVRVSTLGLTATFFGVVSVNTTGSTVVNANASRKIGVWVTNNTASLTGLAGDALSTAVVPVGGGTAALLLPIFVPGNGAIYVKASSGVISITGYWI